MNRFFDASRKMDAEDMTQEELEGVCQDLIDTVGEHLVTSLT